MNQKDCASTRLVGVIPLNQLDRAKSRLASALTPAERATLALTLAERTLRALAEAHTIDRIAVVSPDPVALAWAEAHGAIPLRQAVSAHGARSGALNAGLAVARDWATEEGANGLLIALGDLPLLTAAEVRRFTAMTRLYERVVALAPDRARDGTNLLLARPASLAPLAYGRGSFARHRRLALRQGVPVLEYDALGAAFDIDTPADLDELITRGLWAPAAHIADDEAASRKRPVTQEETP
ncbi:MAG TPA: 2-phospho-L-lactate guanylyltransferase [Ktedonobacterales bacterium]|jgi:2-phospho-L-lactate guanylyltransferase|nr:2-phospho-L-lactate guanylyltransferase [Ktedonobacterales bacterium]